MGFPSGQLACLHPREQGIWAERGGKLWDVGCSQSPTWMPGVPGIPGERVLPWPGRFGNLAREQQEMTVTDCEGLAAPGGLVSSEPLTHLACCLGE